MNVIQIDKLLIPCKFNILLGGEWFGLNIRYNAVAELFTVDLYKDDELICAGEPIVYDIPLWKAVRKDGLFPNVDIIPTDPSGEANRVTYDNLFDTVLLAVTDRGGETDG